MSDPCRLSRLALCPGLRDGPLDIQLPCIGARLPHADGSGTRSVRPQRGRRETRLSLRCRTALLPVSAWAGHLGLGAAVVTACRRRLRRGSARGMLQSPARKGELGYQGVRLGVQNVAGAADAVAPGRHPGVLATADDDAGSPQIGRHRAGAAAKACSQTSRTDAMSKLTRVFADARGLMRAASHPTMTTGLPESSSRTTKPRPPLRTRRYAPVPIRPDVPVVEHLHHQCGGPWPQPGRPPPVMLGRRKPGR